ncbi:hypothetical protein EBO34_12490 [Alteribacter keqinensis]|uniref:Uncharacterized protein n=1 Tax=Alteribacter keqinensis TaxID=2483800 RepID=A0A3M7TQ52_9BACI|nr:hypothetical protein EBO34_12490 [Alteribacter keqinensis]
MFVVKRQKRVVKKKKGVKTEKTAKKRCANGKGAWNCFFSVIDAFVCFHTGNELSLLHWDAFTM